MQKMDRYYYLISQLPVLVFDKPSYLTITHFLEEAYKWLNTRDYHTLIQAKLENTESIKRGSRLLKEYRRFEYDFRMELSLLRKALKSGQDFKPEKFPISLVKEGNPLEVEKKLLAWRWAYLNEHEKNHHFDLGFLIVYYLKLQILEHLSRFNKEKGLEIFHQLIALRPLENQEENGDMELKNSNLNHS